jgi:hypothetical protein
MFLKVWRFLTLMLAALALTMTSAHVLELSAKMRYDPELYATVNGTMYRNFAVVGGAYTIASIVAATVLAILVRGRGVTVGWTVAGAGCLLLGFVSWLALVAPVNGAVAAAHRATPTSVPALWTELRPRWEYGHAAGFIIQLVGFGALLVSILAETPRRVSGRVR